MDDVVKLSHSPVLELLVKHLHELISSLDIYSEQYNSFNIIP